MSRFNGKRGRFSRFSLSASITPPAAYSVVTGGTLFSSDAYYYRVFTASDSFNVSEAPLNADILVVGGGGSGGSNGYSTKSNGAGGGAGGDFNFISLKNFLVGDYAVIIGAGAPGAYVWGDYASSNGSDGSASETFSTSGSVDGVRAFGGGAGRNAAYYGDSNGGNSGSRIGGLSKTGVMYGYFAGGGGAGSGENGYDAVQDYRLAYAGAGGNGTNAFSSWLNTVGLGVNGYFGGGGGGAPSWNPFVGPSTSTSPGGLGGGTIGVFSWWNNPVMPESSPANTGGGSGGIYRNAGWSSGNGGSGFTIIRYLKSEVEYVPPVTTTVSGGTLFEGGDYYYRAFTSSDTLTVSDGTLDAEVLVVAGGGGGANGYAGGGGAGGLIHLTDLLLTNESVPVLVGAGGASWTYGGYGSGFNGSNTEFGATVAIGGGFGPSFSNPAGNGGSGGGSGWNSGPAGTGVPGQGHDGASYVYQGGGGGGYVTAGSGYEGGQGTSEFNEWGVTTGTGKVSTGGLRYYAAGGNSETSGNTDYGRTPGWTSAQPWTGCGGAGNGISLASGGSGLVIIKYPKTSVA